MKLTLLLGVLTLVCATACNIITKQKPSQTESVQSIHHSGKVLLWWSGDATTFYVKACDEAVADQKIETLEAMTAACKGEGIPKATTRAELVAMLVAIADEDTGFKDVIKDKAKAELLAKLKSQIKSASYDASGAQVALAALEAQLKDLAANLAKVRADVAKMKAIADAAAQAAGHPATPDDIDVIFGPAYAAAVKTVEVLEKSEETTKAGAAAQVSAYEALQKTIAAARGQLATLVGATLDRIANKDAVFTVSLLQKENFEFALLETAAMRLGLLASHAPEVVSCKQVCEAASPFADTARCYACRCKEALGPLPTPAEVNCANAKQMQVFKVKEGPEGFDLEELKASADECWNPSLLYGDCEYGSKLGQLTKGSSHYKWICRHRSSPDMSDPNATYDDVGVIGQNMETGATCWWDDYGDKVSDKFFPKLDLTNATQKEVDDFKSTFYNTTGESCTACHDNDPFMYSPYLRTVDWVTEGYTDAKYSTVQYDGTLRKVGHGFLASEEASECTGCHRISSRSTCASWAKQSMGVEKGSGFEPLVLDALDKDEGGVRKAGKNWQLAYWMTPVKSFHKGTWDKWHEKNGGAKDTILKCCADPKAAGCNWVDAEGKPSNPDGTLTELPSGPVAPAP